MSVPRGLSTSISLSAIAVLSLAAFVPVATAAVQGSPPRQSADVDDFDGPVLVIDGSRGFSGSIEELIAAYPDDKADVTIRVENTVALDGEARRARDEQRTAMDTPVQRTSSGGELTCEDRAAAARADGTVVAMLSCLDHPSTKRDSRFEGEDLGAVLEALTATLEAATARPLSDPLTGVFAGGHLDVSVPASVTAMVMKLDDLQKWSLDESIYSTLSTLRTVSSAALETDGDCYAWAVATGGDSCGGMTFAAWED